MRLYKKLYKVICPAPIELCDELRAELININWSDKKYNRFEKTLENGKLLEMPYKLSHTNVLDKNDQLTLTTQKLVDWINTQDGLEKFEPVRGEIATLLPGVELGSHRDRRWFHANARRMHVPLFTNKDSWHNGYVIKWGEGIELAEKYHMPVDTLFELNNVDWHQAGNHGDSPRTHLIIDFMPMGFLAKRISEGQLPNDRAPVNAFAEWVSNPEET